MARDYGKVTPRFWIGETGKNLRGDLEAQVIALYLITNQHANMIGIYYMPLIYLSHETGIPFEGASKGLRRVEKAGFCAYDEVAEVVWVYEMAKHQISGTLKMTDKQCKGVANEYKAIPDNDFVEKFYEKYSESFHLTEKRMKPLRRASKGASKPLRSQEQEQEQEQEHIHDSELSPLMIEEPRRVATAPPVRGLVKASFLPPTPERILEDAIYADCLAVNGNVFTNYPKERRGARELARLCFARCPEDPRTFATGIADTFNKLKTSGDKFWRGQPFLPSVLATPGIFDRIIEAGRSEQKAAPSADWAREQVAAHAREVAQ